MLTKIILAILGESTEIDICISDSKLLAGSLCELIYFWTSHLFVIKAKITPHMPYISSKK